MFSSCNNFKLNSDAQNVVLNEFKQNQILHKLLCIKRMYINVQT